MMKRRLGKSAGRARAPVFSAKPKRRGPRIRLRVPSQKMMAQMEELYNLAGPERNILFKPEAQATLEGIRQRMLAHKWENTDPVNLQRLYSKYAPKRGAPNKGPSKPVRKRAKWKPTRELRHL